MKITKVNNTRSAVSSNQRIAHGILYPYPNQRKKDGVTVYPPVKDLETHFKEINGNAKRLYNILSPEKPEKKYGRVPSVLRDKIQKYFKKLVAFNDKDPADTVAGQMDFIEGRSEEMESFLFVYNEEPAVRALVNTYLRKSLRKNVEIKGSNPVRKCNLLDVVEKLVKALCVSKEVGKEERSDSYRNAVLAIDREERRTFLEALNNDYTRSIQFERIRTSIENQNVKAKVVLKDGHYLLKPSFADHKVKSAIFDFMLGFADGTEEERSDLLNYMRGLIVLYVCGPVVYNELAENGIRLKDFADPYINKDLVFCPKAAEIFKEEEPKGLKRRLRGAYEYELVKHYKEALHVFTLEAENDLSEGMEEETRKGAIEEKIRNERYWLDFIEKEVKGAIGLSKPDREYKNNAIYLCRKVWKRWTAFMAEKYIDLGKAVYHFAMPVMPHEKDAKFGIVRKKYENGLTSFDYERVKAVENMERNVSVAVTFAVNNFSRSALRDPAGNTTDILFLKDDQLDGSLYEDTGHRILRYFGGASVWAGNTTVSDAAEGRGDALFFEIRDLLGALRNGSYHYTQKFGDVKAKVVPAMLESEKEWLGPIVRKKYFSNNTHWFYPVNDLNGLMNTLYQTPASRGDQVPAFSRLYNRNTLIEEKRIFTADICGKINGLGKEKADIFKGAAFFLFKEIYYYSFLKEKDIAAVFKDLVFSKDVPCDNLDALRNFRDRIKEIRYGASMGEIAQVIMTDYNLQNQQKETAQIVSSDKMKEENVSYRSFPMILYRYMRLTFLAFLDRNKEKFGFLYSPVWQESQTGTEEADFCYNMGGQEVAMFGELFLKKEGEKSVAPWYVLGHMIPPAQLNHLSGALRSYICYLNDIDRRALQTGNKNPAVYKANQKECTYFERVLEVLEFCRFFCGNTSKEYTDYYPQGQYAGEIFRYVDIKDHLGESAGVSDEEILAAFCRQETGHKNPDGTPQKIGLFHDGENPILNRNLVLASLYGTDRIIRNAADKVTEKDIRDYYDKRNTLMQENAWEKMDAENRYRSERELQNRKNHIELVNVKTYSDILNDLMIQMVSWAYFRERDQLYLALGTQYLRLYYGDHVKEGSLLRKLSWKGTVNGKDIDINIDEGAVLYQIAALYTYHLPLYQVKFDESGNINEIKERRGMSGSKQQYFDSYCRSQDVAWPTKYFFEVVADSGKIRALRNYIDHFAYFVNADRSILDLYSDIYNIFFSYSENYRKSVTFILPNILSRYFVLTGLHMDKETRQTANANNVIVSRNCAGIRLDKELKSFLLTYNVEADAEDKAEEKKEGSYSSKTGKGKGKKGQSSGKSSNKKKTSVKVAARDGKFLNDVKQILCYPKC